MPSEQTKWLAIPDLLRNHDRALEAVHEAGHAVVCHALGGTVTSMDLSFTDDAQGGTAIAFAGLPLKGPPEWTGQQFQEAADDLVAVAAGSDFGWASRYVVSIYGGWVAQTICSYVKGRRQSAEDFERLTDGDASWISLMVKRHRSNGRDLSTGVPAEVLPEVISTMWMQAWNLTWNGWPTICHLARKLLLSSNQELGIAELRNALTIKSDVAASPMPPDLPKECGWPIPLSDNLRPALKRRRYMHGLSE